MSRKSPFSAIPIFAICLFITQASFAQSKMLANGDAAPIFTAKASQAGKDFTFSLRKALARGPVVLYFYPAAYTGGCDLEAHTFAENKNKFIQAKATIIGISADDIQRLNLFSSDPHYCAGKFPVASDPGGKIASTYGLTLIPPMKGVKDVRGQEVTHGFIPRTTFVINRDDKIVAVFSSDLDKISPAEHVQKALAIVKKL